MQNTMPQKGTVLAGGGLSVCAAETESLFYLPGIRKSFQYAARQTSESDKQVLRNF